MKKTISLLIVIIISGCGHRLAIPLNEDSFYDEKKTYVFGSIVCGHWHGVTIPVITIEKRTDLSTVEIHIQSELNSELFLMPLKPGRYRLKSVNTFHSGDIWKAGSISLYDDGGTWYDLKPGKLYYLGNYEISLSRNLTRDYRIWNFQIQEAINDFNATSKAFLNRYINFRSAEMIDIFDGGEITDKNPALLANEIGFRRSISKPCFPFPF